MTETVTDSTNVEEELLSFWNYIFPLNASAMPHVLISTQIRLVRTFVLIILTLLQLETGNMTYITVCIKAQSRSHPLTCKLMLYVLRCFDFNQASGPTTCGDEGADKEIMKYLGAQLVHTFGNNL